MWVILVILIKKCYCGSELAPQIVFFHSFEYIAIFIFGCLPENILFQPILGGFGRYFPQMWSPIVLILKRHFCALKYVVWAIKRKSWPAGSTWARDRENVTTGQVSQSHKVAIFRLFWEKLPQYRLKTKICMVGNLYPLRHNDVCEVSRCNFQGVRYTGGRISHGPYNIAGLLRCLRFVILVQLSLHFIENA